MIAKLSGSIDSIFSDRVIIDVSGVGYLVLCSSRTTAALSQDQVVTFWIESIFRADSQQLCGFMSYEEQICFRELTSVQGVGAKAALSLLSTLTPDEIVDAIVQKNKNQLIRADGVGPKVAERMINELQNSKNLRSFNFTSATVAIQPSMERDVVSALVSLGYDKYEAARVVRLIYKDAMTTQELLKAALKKISIAS